MQRARRGPSRPRPSPELFGLKARAKPNITASM